MALQQTSEVSENLGGLDGVEVRWRNAEFDGVHRDTFVQALRAEGVPCNIGPTRPLYTFDMFASGTWGKTGCPIRCPLYGREVDYTQVHCPEAERIHQTEAVDIFHRFLLGPLKDMDLILAAMAKIRALLPDAGLAAP